MFPTRIPQAAIDWHEFVVVESIDFYAEEDEGLPTPLSLAEVVAALRVSGMEESAPSSNAEPRPVADMDAEERAMVAQGLADPAQPPLVLLHPAPEPQMKIVRNYKRHGPSDGGTDSLRYVVSPITGELVAVDAMAEHMRISLIDPKWRVEREAMMGKLRGSTVASDEELARNIVSLARTRPDIFGSAEEEVSIAVSNELKRRSDEIQAQATQLQPAAQQQPQHHLPQLLRPMIAPPPLQSYSSMLPPGMPPPMLFPSHPHLPPGASPPFGFPPQNAYAPYGPPPVGPGAPAAFPDDPAVKRARDDEILAEDDFAEAHPDPVTIHVVLPSVEGDAELNGQTVALSGVLVMETVGDMKARLAKIFNLPASKQKMSSAHHGFLKDTATLAFYNFGDHTELICGLKARGGKK